MTVYKGFRKIADSWWLIVALCSGCMPFTQSATSSSPATVLPSNCPLPGSYWIASEARAIQGGDTCFTIYTQDLWQPGDEADALSERIETSLVIVIDDALDVTSTASIASDFNVIMRFNEFRTPVGSHNSTFTVCFPMNVGLGLHRVEVRVSPRDSTTCSFRWNIAVSEE